MVRRDFKTVDDARAAAGVVKGFLDEAYSQYLKFREATVVNTTLRDDEHNYPKMHEAERIFDYLRRRLRDIDEQIRRLRDEDS